MKALTVCLAVVLGCACWAAQAGAQEAGQPTTRPARAERRSDWSHRMAEMRPARQVTPEQEKELLEALRQHQPERYERMTKLREEDPKRYRLLLNMGWAWYEQWKSLSPEAQQAFLRSTEKRVQIGRLMHQLSQTKDPAPREEIIGQLRGAIGEMLSADQVVAEYRLAELRQRVTKMQQKLEQQQANHEQLVEEHLQRLLKHEGRRPPRMGPGENPAEGPGPRDGHGPGPDAGPPDDAVPPGPPPGGLLPPGDEPPPPPDAEPSPPPTTQPG